MCILITDQHILLGEGKLGGKYQAHLLKGKGKMDSMNRVQFDVFAQKPARHHQGPHRQPQ
jgi:hypothetical protein